MKNKTAVRLFIGLFLVMVLAVLPFMAACSNAPSSPTVVPSSTTAKNTPSTTAASTTNAANPIKLTVAYNTIAGTPNDLMFTQWCKEIQTRSQGRVQLTQYPGETLGKVADEFNMLQTGICDITWLIPSYYPGEFTLFAACDYPFQMSVFTPTASNELYSKYLSKDPTCSKVHVLFAQYTGELELHSVKTQINTQNDLKGLQIRCPAGGNSDGWKALGGTPVVIPLSDVYNSLQTGLINGVFLGVASVRSYKIYEVTKYYLTDTYSDSIAMASMSLQTWNKLPADIQKIFTDTAPTAQQFLYDTLQTEIKAARTASSNAGNVLYTLTPAEKAKWLTAINSVVDPWAKKMDAQGLPGSDLINGMRTISNSTSTSK